MPKDFMCDTEDCIYYSTVEEDCIKGTAITIQDGCCCDYEERVNEVKKPRYILVRGVPKLGSEVYIQAGSSYYKGTFLGYGAYGDDPDYKMYCVQIKIPNRIPFVDYVKNIYIMED